MYSKITTTTIIMAAILVTNANAAVIYDNGSPVAAAGDVLSDWGYSTYGQQAADDFVLPLGGNVITDVYWWGTYRNANSPTTDNFTIRFYASAGGSPNLTHDHEFIVGHVGRVDTGINSYGVDIYSYSAVLASPLPLLASTTYWLSIINDTTTDTNDSWYWSRVSIGGNGAGRTALDTIPWSTGASTHAFQLQMIPEPSAFIPATLGLLGLVLRCGRRKREVEGPR